MVSPYPSHTAKNCFPFPFIWRVIPSFGSTLMSLLNVRRKQKGRNTQPREWAFLAHGTLVNIAMIESPISNYFEVMFYIKHCYWRRMFFYRQLANSSQSLPHMKLYQKSLWLGWRMSPSYWKKNQLILPAKTHSKFVCRARRSFMFCTLQCTSTIINIFYLLFFTVLCRCRWCWHLDAGHIASGFQRRCRTRSS